MYRLLLTFALLYPATVWADNVQYIEIKCLSDIGDDPREVFNGKLVVTKLERSMDGILIEGREFTLRKTQIQNANCRSWHMVYDEYWDGSQWQGHYVKRNRDWNALELSKNNSQVFLFCHRSSVLNVFDSKDAFLDSVFRKYSRNDRENTISHRDCLIDQL